MQKEITEKCKENIAEILNKTLKQEIINQWNKNQEVDCDNKVSDNHDKISEALIRKLYYYTLSCQKGELETSIQEFTKSDDMKSAAQEWFVAVKNEAELQKQEEELEKLQKQEEPQKAKAIKELKEQEEEQQVELQKAKKAVESWWSFWCLKSLNTVIWLATFTMVKDALKVEEKQDTWAKKSIKDKQKQILAQIN